ncbi:MAG TPA: hypothetical protein VEU62_03175 [Bryobacterales bacterium]|nr:hypothetical protein [Bryobacterales bacterium]
MATGENVTVPAKDPAPGLPIPVLVAAALVLAGVTVAFFWFRHERYRPPDVPVLTREATAYLPNLQLEDVDMKAAENYLKQTATAITGKITNKGPRTLRLVEINCVFRDFSGRPVLRERTAIIGRRTGPVSTGQTRPFSLNFDNIPDGWNQQIPDLIIAQIQFQD